MLQSSSLNCLLLVLMFRLMNRNELFAFAMMLFMLKDQIRSLLLFGSIGSVEFLIVECV